MTINDLTFLGRPIYAREDGTWARSEKKNAQPEWHDQESDTQIPNVSASDSEVEGETSNPQAA